MNIFVGITDEKWFENLRYANYPEINFWKPGVVNAFSALKEFEMFLFKLHSPKDFIVGGGFFVRYSVLPTTIAWDVFGKGNGTNSWIELRDKIKTYRKTNANEIDPTIGCITITSPFFFDPIDWIRIPSNWSKNIVSGKIYSTDNGIGENIYLSVQTKLRKDGFGLPVIKESSEENRYGLAQLIKPRLGQGAFKIMITEAYNKRCAITGEKTLPVLQAAHIKPYSDNGPHDVKNGMLLRQDLHTLFDRGFITIDEKYRIVVSPRIKDEYGNGREYYAYHGKNLIVLPDRIDQRPAADFLNWHNQSIFRG